MPRSSASSNRRSPASSLTSPHQVEPSAQVPKPISDASRSVSPKRRVLTRRSLDQPSRGLGQPPEPVGSVAAMASGGSNDPRGPGFLLTAQGWPYMLVPFIPLAIALELAHVSATVIFFTAALGIIPTAALMGQATEELAARSGPGIGGLLNVTFGNAPELIIALFALAEGLHEVVKASIVGSIIGNVLLVLGASMLVGGIGRRNQTFNATAASAQSSMLLLAAAALMMPAIFELVEGKGLPSPTAELVNYGSTVENLSLAVAIVLIGTYVAGLFFSLRTHRDLFNPPYAEQEEEGFGWSVRRSVLMLFIAGLTVGLMSEILVGSISEASESVGLSEFFIGAIVVAIVGNAAEHWVAVLVAYKDKDRKSVV